MFLEEATLNHLFGLWSLSQVDMQVINFNLCLQWVWYIVKMRCCRFAAGSKHGGLEAHYHTIW